MLHEPACNFVFTLQQKGIGNNIYWVLPAKKRTIFGHRYYRKLLKIVVVLTNAVVTAAAELFAVVFVSVLIIIVLIDVNVVVVIVFIVIVLIVGIVIIPI